MKIHKLLEKRSFVRPNQIVRTFHDCESIGEAQGRLATRRGCPVRDYFVTDVEWHRYYSPAAQKKPTLTDECNSFEALEALELAEAGCS
jgi:hypothetical protein